MSGKPDGFPIADVSTDLLNDPKVRRLVRSLRDPDRTASALLIYLAVLLESWSAGGRVTVDDALPAWYSDVPAESVAALVGVGLLDDDGRLPEQAFEGWFRPAFERREQRRTSGSIGGKRSGAVRRKRSDAEATLQQMRSTTEPVRTVVPTNVGTDVGTTTTNDHQSAADALARHGLDPSIVGKQHRRPS